MGFGQTICLPVGPRCDLCDVASVSGLCPSERVVKLSPKKREQEEAKAKIEVTVDPILIKGEIVEGVIKKDESGNGNGYAKGNGKAR